MNTLKKTNTCYRYMAIALVVIAFQIMLRADDANVHNVLSSAEKQQGWHLLFDGKTTAGWRGFHKSSFPAGWRVTDGSLECLGQNGGDIVTTEKYTDFELTWEWQLSPKGNSGVKYFIDEKRTDANGKVYASAIGHEYQMIDDMSFPEPLTKKQRTGSLYEIIAPTGAQAKPPGEFNKSRLVVKGKHVEHWLNGVLIVAYETDSAEISAGIAKSKFKNIPGFADKMATPILLQDHDAKVWFRNIKVRPLTLAK